MTTERAGENPYSGLSQEERERVVCWLEKAEVEVLPSSVNLEKILTRPPSGSVDVTSSEDWGVGVTVAFAVRLQQQGISAVPHLPARNIKDEEFEPLMTQLAEGGIKKVLVVGGDNVSPKGRWNSAMELMRDMVTFGYIPEELQVAGYPRKHSVMKKSKERDSVLAEKVNFAGKMGIPLVIKSQICAYPESVSRWANHLQQIGIDNPLTLGLLGPTKLVKAGSYFKEVGVNEVALIIKRVATGNMIEDLSLLRFDTGDYLRELAQTQGINTRINNVCLTTMGDYNRTLDLIDETTGLLSKPF